MPIVTYQYLKPSDGSHGVSTDELDSLMARVVSPDGTPDIRIHSEWVSFDRSELLPLIAKIHQIANGLKEDFGHPAYSFYGFALNSLVIHRLGATRFDPEAWKLPVECFCDELFGRVPNVMMRVADSQYARVCRVFEDDGLWETVVQPASRVPLASPRISIQDDSGFEIISRVVDLVSFPADNPFMGGDGPLEEDVREIFTTADTKDVQGFQSSNIRKILHRRPPECFSDLMDLYALYRPGSIRRIGLYFNKKRDAGKSGFTITPSPNGFLYYEEVWNWMQDVAGEASPETDCLCHRILFSNPLDMVEDRQRFVATADKSGRSEEATRGWDWLAENRRSLASKGGAIAYADLAYKMACLKVRQPEMFRDAVFKWAK